MTSARTNIVSFSPDSLPAVVRFAEQTWNARQSSEFYRWRFCDAPAETLLAMRGDECLGMISAFRRTYRAGDAAVTVTETFDWYTRPDVRRSGLGVLLLREIMRRPDPMIVVGGSAETLSMLPRMGWTDLADAGLYMLPLSGSAISARVEQAWRIPRAVTEVVFDWSARLWFSSARHDPDANMTMTSANGVQDAGVLSLYSGAIGYGCLPVPDFDRLRWLTSRPETNTQFLSSCFLDGSSLRGWSLACLYDAEGSRQASLIECFAPNPDLALYRWMVSATVERLKTAGAEKVLARATCPILRSALSDNRFLARGTVPVRVFNSDPGFAPPVHLTYNVGDADMLPAHAPSSDD